MAVEAEARKEAGQDVFNQYFTELVRAIQGDVLPIANGCLAKKLITTSCHNGITGSTAPTSEQATKLLTAVRDCMEHQNQCYSKFLDVLKQEGIFDELIKRLSTSFDEAVNRKVTAECTDAPLPFEHKKKASQLPKPVNTQAQIDALNVTVATLPSPMGVMLARQTAIKRHMPELKASVRSVIAAVASSSLTKELISSETYRKVIRSRKSVEHRTKCLLVNVCNTCRENGKKFNVFMEILESHRSCQELALTIQNDVKTLREGRKAELVVATPPAPPVPLPASPVLRQRRSKKLSHAGSIAASDDCSKEKDRNIVVGIDTVSAPKVVKSGEVDYQQQVEYNLRMEAKQREAKLEDLRTKEETSEQEKVKLQHTVLELNDKLRKTDERYECLRVERDDLKLVIESLRVNFSQKEKELSVSEDTCKALKDQLTELESEMAVLQKEKHDLQMQVKDLTCQVDHLICEVNDLTCEVQSLQLTIATSQMKLKNDLKKDLNSSLKEGLESHLQKVKSTGLTCTPLVIALASLFGFFVLVGIVFLWWLLRHW